MRKSKRNIDAQEAVNLTKMKLSPKLYARLTEHFKIMKGKIKDGQSEGNVESERVDKRLLLAEFDERTA